MQHPTSRIAVAMWAANADQSGPPTTIVRLEAQHPGASVLEGNLSALNPKSTPNEIQRAFSAGLGQCDFISVVDPDAEPQPVPAPEPVDQVMPEQPTKEVFDAAYAALSDEDKAKVDGGTARINVDGVLEAV